MLPQQTGTAGQWIKEHKQTVKMTSCHPFRSNEVQYGRASSLDDSLW